MSSNSTFRGKEIEALLAAAARLQEQDANSDPDAIGLSLEEIEAIAAESGIDPAYVRRAATVRQTGVSEQEDDFFFWGGPPVVRRNLILNRRLSKLEMERLVPVFRRITENEGRADSLDGSLSWRTNNRKNQGGTVVMLQDDGEQTVCTLKSTVWMPGFLIHYVPIMMTLLAILPIGGAEGFSPAYLAAKLLFLSLVFLGTRFGYSKLYKRNRTYLEEIQKAIESVAAEGARDSQPVAMQPVASTSSVATAQQTQGRIQLDEQPRESGDDSTSGRGPSGRLTE